MAREGEPKDKGEKNVATFFSPSAFLYIALAPPRDGWRGNTRPGAPYLSCGAWVVASCGGCGAPSCSTSSGMS